MSEASHTYTYTNHTHSYKIIKRTENLTIISTISSSKFPGSTAFSAAEQEIPNPHSNCCSAILLISCYCVILSYFKQVVVQDTACVLNKAHLPDVEEEGVFIAFRLC